jgi:hypothetical protein
MGFIAAKAVSFAHDVDDMGLGEGAGFWYGGDLLLFGGFRLMVRD